MPEPIISKCLTTVIIIIGIYFGVHKTPGSPYQARTWAPRSLGGFSYWAEQKFFFSFKEEDYLYTLALSPREFGSRARPCPTRRDAIL